ncbi:elongation factor 1-alpha C-terminal domain-related protein, partial [Gilvimarinus sp. 1_MG-2023]|nr:sulfate adenylyltransferase subunit CysN [Gilvimarinus sp. 1_MG-2023]
EKAFVGQSITLTLEDEIDISRGDVIVKVNDQPIVGNRFNADLVWMTEQSMVPGRPYDLKFATGASAGTISKIHNLVDINTMEKREA